MWAPNIHFKEPNPDIPALLDGRVRVVTEPLPIKGGIVGVNSFGFGGSNVHMILRPPGPVAAPQGTKPPLAVPRLLQACGRTEEAVNELVRKARDNANNAGFLSILNDISTVPAASMPYRGYALIGSEADALEVQQAQATSRPLWYICSGEDCQTRSRISRDDTGAAGGVGEHSEEGRCCYTLKHLLLRLS